MRLYHFSEDGDIARFVPRPVRVPAPRAPGMDWLNGPLVWAIDEAHRGLYLFPRECPRVLYWPQAATTAADRRRYWTDESVRMVACIEAPWLPALARTPLYRYTLPAAGFEPLHDAGMWVSRGETLPLAVARIVDLPQALIEAGVALRVVADLGALARLLQTSLHVSGIRLRNRGMGPGIAMP